MNISFSMVLAPDEYQQSRYKQAKQRERSRKRICDLLQDTAAPSLNNARRRPQKTNQTNS